MDLPDPGIKPGSPALQADSLPTELSGRDPRDLREVSHLNLSIMFLTVFLYGLHFLVVALGILIYMSPIMSAGINISAV